MGGRSPPGWAAGRRGDEEGHQDPQAALDPRRGRLPPGELRHPRRPRLRPTPRPDPPLGLPPRGGDGPRIPAPVGGGLGLPGPAPLAPRRGPDGPGDRRADGLRPAHRHPAPGRPRPDLESAPRAPPGSGRREDRGAMPVGRGRLARRGPGPGIPRLRGPVGLARRPGPARGAHPRRPGSQRTDDPPRDRRRDRDGVAGLAEVPEGRAPDRGRVLPRLPDAPRPRGGPRPARPDGRQGPQLSPVFPVDRRGEEHHRWRSGRSC
jgi:hypothetical protein